METEPCDLCRTAPAIGYLLTGDPYDAISNSPIRVSKLYCLSCYNDRVIAALKCLGAVKADAYDPKYAHDTPVPW
jgi:hypothetical protein